MFNDVSRDIKMSVLFSLKMEISCNSLLNMCTMSIFIPILSNTCEMFANYFVYIYIYIYTYIYIYIYL